MLCAASACPARRVQNQEEFLAEVKAVKPCHEAVDILRGNGGKQAGNKRFLKEAGGVIKNVALGKSCYLLSVLAKLCA